MRITKAEQVLAEAFLATASERIQSSIRAYAADRGITVYEAILTAILMLDNVRVMLEKKKGA